MKNSEYIALAPNIWQQHFTMFELKQIMRQMESKEFAEILDRLREGNHTSHDIAKIKERCISTTQLMFPICSYKILKLMRSIIEFTWQQLVTSIPSKH